MEEVKAVAKHILQAPRKVRLVADLIRGKKVEEAETILEFTPKRAAKLMKKVLRSAYSNAEQNNNLAKDQLYVSQVYVGPGSTFKRYCPRAMGRASTIHKRTSNVTVMVKKVSE